MQGKVQQQLLPTKEEKKIKKTTIILTLLAILHILQFSVAGELQSLSFFFSRLHHQLNTITTELHLFLWREFRKKKTVEALGLGGKKGEGRKKGKSKQPSREEEQDATSWIMGQSLLDLDLKSTVIQIFKRQLGIWRFDDAASDWLIGRKGKVAFSGSDPKKVNQANTISSSSTIFMHNTCTGYLQQRRRLSFHLGAMLDVATL